jgi:hypothetical protein
MLRRVLLDIVEISRRWALVFNKPLETGARLQQATGGEWSTDMTEDEKP